MKCKSSSRQILSDPNQSFYPSRNGAGSGCAVVAEQVAVVVAALAAVVPAYCLSVAGRGDRCCSAAMLASIAALPPHKSELPAS